MHTALTLWKCPQMIENLFSNLPMRTAPLGDLCQPQAGSQTPITPSLYLSRTYTHSYTVTSVAGCSLGAESSLCSPRFPPPLQSCSSPCPLSLEIAIQLSAWLESFASWQGRKGGPPKPRGSERWMDSRRKNRTGLDLERNIGRGRAYTLFFSFFQRN